MVVSDQSQDIFWFAYSLFLFNIEGVPSRIPFRSGTHFPGDVALESSLLCSHRVFTRRGGISIDPYCNYGKPGTMFEEMANNRLMQHNMYSDNIDNR